MDLKIQTQGVVMIERPYIDVPTSLLGTIQQNLRKLLKEEIIESSPILEEIIKSAWKAELDGIDKELTLRN
jgi:hypothetical protein